MDQKAEVIAMLLWCPECRARHIDEGEFATKPHHTHACQSCGMVWRPAILCTVGVQFLPGFKNGPGDECPPGKGWTALYPMRAEDPRPTADSNRASEDRIALSALSVPDTISPLHITSDEFRALLDLFMASDPAKAGYEVTRGMLDRLANVRRFDDWVQAFNQFRGGPGK